jgi:predicted O-methyltransferase YrrM
MKILGDGFNIYASETGESKDRLLFSLKDYGENLSGLPLVNELDYETESIFGIFNKIAADYDKFSRIPKNPQSLISILEVTGKLMKCLCQKHRPYNILELGAEQGLLSYFLAYVARAFNKENMLHCVSNNLLSDEWLLFLQEYGEAAENLNLHIMLPQNLSLQENYFDFCIINGSENFSNSDAVLNNAIRLLATDGALVFIPQDGNVIEQKITLKEKQTAYRQTEEASINLRKGEMEILMRQMENRFAGVEALTKEELCLLVKDLAYLEKLAAGLFAHVEDMNLKRKLNTAKENVLNLIYSPSEEMRNLFISKIINVDLFAGGVASRE